MGFSKSRLRNAMVLRVGMQNSVASLRGSPLLVSEGLKPFLFRKLLVLIQKDHEFTSILGGTDLHAAVSVEKSHTCACPREGSTRRKTSMLGIKTGWASSQRPPYTAAHQWLRRKMLSFSDTIVCYEALSEPPSHLSRTQTKQLVSLAPFYRTRNRGPERGSGLWLMSHRF